MWACRGIAEHAYCPRLFYYMTVEGVFLPSADTEEGAGVHRRVDRPSEAPPGPVKGTDASLEEGGLFSRPDTHLRTGQNGRAALTLYFRAVDDAAAELLLDLLHELSLVGFGADVATGRGQFEIAGDPEPADDLDARPTSANGVITLSTFQPAPGDPTDGFWEAFPKFGKLGPDLALDDVRKHTLIMFRPGACFRADPATPFLGRVLPMDEVLPSQAASTLRSRGVEIIHPAFGLAVPSSIVDPTV